MEPKNVLKKALLWTGGCIAAIVVMMGLLMLIGLISIRVINSRAQHKLLEGAKIGSTKAEVIERLGEPRWVLTKQSELDELYPGWVPIPHFPIEKEVLMITGGTYWWCVFVYINKQGRVTRAVLART